MNAVETLARFFQAENDRDWGAYRTFLHEDVVWHLHGEEDRTIRGVEEYLRAIRDVVVLLVDDSRKRSFEVFDFEDGLIRREHEFLLG